MFLYILFVCFCTVFAPDFPTQPRPPCTCQSFAVYQVGADNNGTPIYEQVPTGPPVPVTGTTP